MLTNKQQQAFVDWYIERYYQDYEWEKPYPLPELPKDKEEEESKARKEFLTKLIGVKKAKSTYKIRPYGPQSVLDKVYSSLRLQYWPIFKDNNEHGFYNTWVKDDDWCSIYFKNAETFAERKKNLNHKQQ